MNRRKMLGVLGSLMAGSSRGLSCLWDTDTLKDDVAIQASSLDLILGQFPHHGSVYYKMRISRILRQGEMSLADMNDLAVAYVRVQDFESAEKCLGLAIERDPTHYETLSNIGVTAKKQGDFVKGAEYIKKALALKPAGHMGLGDWYLKALLWRQKYEKSTSDNPPKVNFLGQSYVDMFNGEEYGSDASLADPALVGGSHGAMMLKNDQSFADGFAVFGDYLREAGLLHLAFLADTRALMLGHQNPDEIRRRRLSYLKYHTTFPGQRNMPQNTRNGLVTKPWAKGIAKAEVMIGLGGEWLEAFKASEAELLKGKLNEKDVTIKMVESRLTEQGVKKVRFI